MSRQVYTYTDLTKIDQNGYFREFMKFPQITVSSDLKKCLAGKPEAGKARGTAGRASGFRIADFHEFARGIEERWNSDQSKFHEMILLSEFMRGKLEAAADHAGLRHWLTGCMRNLDSMLSAIILLEQAAVEPEDLQPGGDRNLELFLEAWNTLREKDPVIADFQTRMNGLTTKAAWRKVFQKVFNLDAPEEIDTIVFHGFYFITPHQERIMRLLERSGFALVFLIPYDERYPYVYEIWDESYSVERGYAPKSEWHMERSLDGDPYGEIFEGRRARIQNKLELKEYGSIMEFVDDVKHIREKGFSLYSADSKSANQLLKEYFPEAYGERKILSYPVGLFLGTLNRMWDDELQAIAIKEEDLIECFSSGWLAADGISGKRYLQELVYVLPFFKGCRRVEEWEERIALLREIQQSAAAPFERDLDPDAAVARWQEAIGNPLKNFSMFAVEPGKLELILKLIEQLLEMARELFGGKGLVHVHDHIRTLDRVLKKHELSQELYAEERELIKDIFEILGSDNSFDALCHPSDIARALDLFICGRYEEGEIQTNKTELVQPLYVVDAACMKKQSRVHICMSDVDSLPGGNKDYVWPLTGKKIKETYAATGNPLLRNLIQIMEANTLCNRFFTYCALKNKEVTLSWISTMGEKMLAPSPYVKLLGKAAGVKLTPAAQNAVTYDRVAETPAGPGRIRAYNREKAPAGMVKEARMDYALCPMKYVLSYVVEKYPAYPSDFQMNYALNAFISAVYDLLKEQGTRVDEVYDAVVALFPNMRKVEKRQVYDYLSYDRQENDLPYGNWTECGGRYYTEERLKIHYPNQDVRSAALARFGKLNTPDGRKGLDLYETMAETPDACTFCPHVSSCRNALYAGDQENSYD